MQKITSAETLKAAIFVLEQRQRQEELLFKQQFSIAYESLKPFNLLRKAIPELLTSPELRERLFGSTTGIISGYLSKMLVVRSSKNPLIRLAGIFVQVAITNIISKNSEAFRRITLRLLHNLLSHLRRAES